MAAGAVAEDLAEAEGFGDRGGSRGWIQGWWPRPGQILSIIKSAYDFCRLETVLGSWVFVGISCHAGLQQFVRCIQHVLYYRGPSNIIARTVCQT